MISYVIGALSAIAGYFAKYLMDYHLLKSPRLKLEIVINPYLASLPQNNHRKYTYIIEISVHNFSENPAYNFELLSFAIDKTFVKQTDKNIIPKTPIVSTAPLVVQIVFYTILPITPDTTFMDSKARLVSLKRNFKINYSFQNSLGKVYHQKVSGIMKTQAEVGQIPSI